MNTVLKITAAIMLCVGLIACAGSASGPSLSAYEQRLSQRWIGQSTKALEAEWGSPLSVNNSSTSAQVWSYVHDQSITYPGGYQAPTVVSDASGVVTVRPAEKRPDMKISRICSTDFTIAQQKIIAVSASGNYCE